MQSSYSFEKFWSGTGPIDRYRAMMTRILILITLLGAFSAHASFGECHGSFKEHGDVHQVKLTILPVDGFYDIKVEERVGDRLLRSQTNSVDNRFFMSRLVYYALGSNGFSLTFPSTTFHKKGKFRSERMNDMDDFPVKCTYASKSR